MAGTVYDKSGSREGWNVQSAVRLYNREGKFRNRIQMHLRFEPVEAPNKMTRGYIALRLGLIVGVTVCGSVAVCGPDDVSHASESAIQAVPVTDPPVARSPIELYATNDSESGRATFLFRGNESPPVIMAYPGQTLVIVYRNKMSPHSGELCVDGPCTNMTNLHFHGLHVSPNAPQDDVVTMMVMPGQSIRYAVQIPLQQPPGLYWYHPHPHGESYQQTLDGMSGAIIVEGIEKYVPEVQGLRERVLVLRDALVPGDEPAATALRQAVAIPLANCGKAAGQAGRVFTVNGAVRPSIGISAGRSSSGGSSMLPRTSTPTCRLTDNLWI